MDWKNLPYGVRQFVWQAAVLLALLLAVVFVLGFTVGRWFEHAR